MIESKVAIAGKKNNSWGERNGGRPSNTWSTVGAATFGAQGFAISRPGVRLIC
ncbi:MAG TPA: hypothetical protein VM554_02435 [Acidisarcina sp.]|nr:hypothetical protein [Acidisarcina sp.]